MADHTRDQLAVLFHDQASFDSENSLYFRVQMICMQALEKEAFNPCHAGQRKKVEESSVEALNQNVALRVIGC